MKTTKSGTTFDIVLPKTEDIVAYVTSLTPGQRERLVWNAAQNCAHRGVSRLIAAHKESGGAPIPLVALLEPAARGSGSYSAEWLKRWWGKLFADGGVKNAAPAKQAKEASQDVYLEPAASEAVAKKYDVTEPDDGFTVAQWAALKWTAEQAESAV